MFKNDFQQLLIMMALNFIKTPCAQCLRNQNSNLSVWCKERFIDQKGANSEDRKPSGSPNQSNESPEFRLL